MKRRVGERWPTNFAHRGASLRAPENTLEAFRLAARSGAGGLELDVHMTSDGSIVVIHDDSADRTTEGTGLVRRMTLHEIQSLDAGYRFTPDGGTVVVGSLSGRLYFLDAARLEDFAKICERILYRR